MNVLRNKTFYMEKINLKQNSQFSPLLFCDVNVLRFLKVIAIALICTSVVYLLAANWWMIDKYIRLAIPMLILMSSAIASRYFADNEIARQSLDTISGLMLGLTLAVIGQIYQTGADSYLLFFTWTVLLLPWLYRPNIGVFSMLAVVTQLTLYLYFKQTFWMERAEYIYILLLNLLTALSFIVALRYYPTLRYIFVTFITALSVGSVLSFIHNGGLIHLASVFVLPAGFAVYFYYKKRALESTLLIAGVALSLTIWLLQKFGEDIFYSVGSLFVIAVVIFGWFAAVSYFLTRLFPKSSFSVIPLAIGAWIAGIILAILLLTFWQGFSILMGILFVGIAWLMLYKSSSFFVRQLAYCLWVCGQTAFLVHIGILTENLWLVWSMQLGMLLLTAITRKHWVILTLQLLVAYILGLVALFVNDQFMLNESLLSIIFGATSFILIVVFFTVRYWQSTSYMRSMIVLIIFMLLSTAVLQTFLETARPTIGDMHLQQIIFFCLIPSIFIIGLIFQNIQIFKKPMMWTIPCLGFLLILIGYFEIFIILILMAWAMVNRHHWMRVLSVLLLIFWLWVLYYNLELSFIYKSVTIFLSGLLILLMAAILKRFKIESIAGELS